jgi:uncharacterized protein with HEPN domain
VAVLVHDCLGVDLEKVWDTIRNDPGALEAAVRQILGSNS